MTHSKQRREKIMTWGNGELDSIAIQVARIRHAIQARTTEVAAAVDLTGPWSEEQTVAFEERYCFRFPEGYRAFLTSIGSRGACLSFELVAPGESRSYKDESDQQLWAKLLANIQHPFPLKETWKFRKSEYPTSAAFQALEATFSHGNILIGGDLSGFDWRLIVSGDSRGEVWMRGGDYFTRAGGGWNFLTWFEKFLDGPEDYWGW